MPDQARRLLLAGLRDAHAMEAQAEELMERQSERTEALPEVQARIRSHLEETRQQKLRLERCLDQLGDSPSTVKDTAMSLFGNMTAMMNAASDDELLKNALANNAFEHFEIASYKALLTLCEEAGAPPSVASSLAQSLKEEEQMAAWVDRNIGAVTRACVQYLERRAA